VTYKKLLLETRNYFLKKIIIKIKNFLKTLNYIQIILGQFEKSSNSFVGSIVDLEISKRFS